MFYFGRDATKDRPFGWVDVQDKKWKAGHMMAKRPTNGL
jgi:hypothetical protein